MLFVALLVLLVWFLYRNSTKPRGFPPGPARLPVVGYLPYMEKHSVHKPLWRLSNKYGPVVGLFFGPTPVVVCNGWEAVRESLMNDDLNGRPVRKFRKNLQGGVMRGVMFVEGELWKEQRRFTLHHLRNLGFGKRSHEAVIHDEANDLIAEIIETQGSIKLQNLVGISSINILWAVMGGTRFSRDNPELAHLVDNINKFVRAGEASGGIVEIIPAVRHILPQDHSANVVPRGFKLVQDFITKAVEEHKTDLDPGNPRDFIDIYLNEMNNVVNNKTEKNPQTTFTESQLVAVCTDLFAAGSETGSATVTFGILLMCLYPEVATKLRTEMDAVVGQHRLPSTTDKTDLPYLEAVMAEMFRFRGAAPLTVPHVAVRDTTIQGHRVPANAMVMNNLYSVHMDPEYWADPHHFRPERFITADGSFRKDERIIPFGKGRRTCLGEPLARMTSYVLFSSLVQRFDFELDPAVPVTNTEGIAGFTLQPPDFRVLAKPRY